MRPDLHPLRHPDHSLESQGASHSASPSVVLPTAAAPRSTERQADPMTFDPQQARLFTRVLDPVLRTYFRSEVRDVHNFPDEQTIVIANHDGGMLPVDALAIGSAW